MELLMTKNVKTSGIVVLRPGEIVRALRSGREWLVTQPELLYGLALDPAEVEPVLALTEAAGWLGARGYPRTPQAAQKACQRGTLPGAVKVRGLGAGRGGQWRVPIRDLEAWIERKEKRT